MHTLPQQILQLFRRRPAEVAAVLEAWSITYSQGLAALAELLGPSAVEQFAAALPAAEAESFQAALATFPSPGLHAAVVAIDLRSVASAMQVDIEAQSDTAAALTAVVKTLAAPQRVTVARSANHTSQQLSESEYRELLESAQGLAIAYPEQTARVLRNWLLQN